MAISLLTAHSTIHREVESSAFKQSHNTYYSNKLLARDTATEFVNRLFALFISMERSALYGGVYSEGRRHHNHCRYPNRWVHQGPSAVIVYVRRKAIQVNPRAMAGCCRYSVSRVEYSSRVKVWQGAQPTCWRALNSNGRWRNPLKWLARITFARGMDRAVGGVHGYRWHQM